MASSLQIEAFEQARDRVWKKLTPKEKGELAGTCTIHDVWEVTQKIQKEQAGRGMLGNMNKIRPYLDGLNRYGDVIAVFVSVKPDILGLIWGPIKLLLQLASNYFQGYDKLLDVFHEIGSSLPQFQQIEEIFHNQGSDQIANYLSLFYTEIVEFHYQALRFFRQTRWRALFEVLWPRYEEIFTAIHRNIEKHKGLIDRQVNMLTIKEARQESQEALKRYQEERDFRELCKLEKNISHFDYTPRLYDIQSRYCADTGKWIFTDSRFRAWLDAGSNEAKERLLWLAGVPGAGKTFLCYSILQYLQERAQADGSTCVLYAFPTYDNASGSTQAAITGSLVYQFCQANPPLIPAANKEYDTLSRRSILLNPWGKLLETFICGSEPVYIILDGLDECDQSQRKQLLETVLNLCSSCPNLHILVASRKEFDIRRELEKNCEIVIVEEKNRADIKRFVTGKINNLWNEIKHVAEPGTSDFFKEVARDIVVRSGGMFLYARLTIAHLEGQSTVPQIMAEAYNLPRDLDEIYGRILDRIATILSASEQAVVKRIFSWLICARRPLRSIELEHALLIQSGDTKLQYNRAPYKDLLALCGPIVEKRNEYLTFVHFSAKGYVCVPTSARYMDLIFL
ncbi:hypothetical protein K440DRAFT_605468 [Wilcoxina mikolae CBS 423.85]|nr:hypothetical protein K440DRAFT_605468 [Wilcoxina mikolae CBS 423.85]